MAAVEAAFWEGAVNSFLKREPQKRQRSSVMRQAVDAGLCKVRPHVALDIL